MIQYIRNNDEFGSLLRFGQVLGVTRANVTDILLTFVASFVGALIVNAIGGVLAITICGALLIPAGTFWVQISTGHLYGQIAAKDGKMGAAY